MDLYKYAAQNQLRFPTNRGAMTVEQLFSMPLKSPSGFDLDTTARAVNNELKTMTEESFIQTTTTNPGKERLTVSLDIIKDVIKTKETENASQLAKLRRTEERRKLLDAIGAKKDAALTTASLEDLEKKLAALDD